jgi:hypothetical protein
VSATVSERAKAEPRSSICTCSRPGGRPVGEPDHRDPDLTKDVAQDAFVRVAGRFRHLRFPDAFDATCGARS